jgi:alpha-ketoglutarate-dependent taurine dioxygenase
MSQLKVRNLSPTVGAEIRGLEPQIPLDDETCHELRELFDDRSVLVFPDLDIDGAFQKYLCYMLIGEDVVPEGAPDAESPDEPATEAPPMLVSNKTDQGAAPYGRLLFHCDTMWARKPQPVISLYGVEVEEPNVPTMFVSMGRAWETLPDDLRARIEGLEAKHGHEHHYPNRGGDDDVIDTYYENPKSTVTPIGNRHPRTGRTALYLSEQVTMGIVGLPEAENEELLSELFAHLYDPEQILEHDWHKGDLVVWDNFAVQHARKTVELDGATRTLRKVTGPLTLDPDEFALPVFSKVADRA